MILLKSLLLCFKLPLIKFKEHVRNSIYPLLGFLPIRFLIYSWKNWRAKKQTLFLNLAANFSSSLNQKPYGWSKGKILSYTCSANLWKNIEKTLSSDLSKLMQAKNANWDWQILGCKMKGLCHWMVTIEECWFHQKILIFDQVIGKNRRTCPYLGIRFLAISELF